MDIIACRATSAQGSMNAVTWIIMSSIHAVFDSCRTFIICFYIHKKITKIRLIFLIEAMTLLEEQAETLGWITVAGVPETIADIIGIQFLQTVKFQKKLTRVTSNSC